MSANAITLLQDDAMLEHFKKNAREQADKFDIANVVPEYEALYDRFLIKGAEVMEKKVAG
jgi:hypothetical protein